jgi:hypothetical protein
MTVVRDWIGQVRAKTPTLLEVGKPPPKAVLSFGGAGHLVTYSLGVAQFLQEEKKELVGKSFILGAGSGVIPALALAMGPSNVSLTKVRDAVVDNPFAVTDEPSRLTKLRAQLEALVPPNAHKLVDGRVALAISFSNKDSGFHRQIKENILFGHHVASWSDREDLISCVMAATAPNHDKMMTFRDAKENVMRATQNSLSSELDTYCRHVHIHGFCGLAKFKSHNRHNTYFGRHGFLANTHFSPIKQCFLAFRPDVMNGARKTELLEAFDHGFNDARRYERWEEDPYHFAKADRSPSSDYSWKNARATLFGKGEFSL